jgi:hypothetical protein
MSTVVLKQLRDLFLTGDTEPATRLVHQVAERAVPATLGVLVAPGDAAVVGAALGLAAAAALQAPCALVCRWTGVESFEPLPVDLAGEPAVGGAGGSADGRAGEPAASPRFGLAGGDARRLAQRLAARGLAAGASGRLVTVALPASDIEARAATERALAAAGDFPVVLTIAGPRSPAFDPVLAALDRLVVVPPSGAPEGLERLALGAAAHLGRSVALLRLPPTGAASGRLLTTTGLPLSPAWRKAAASALRGDDG